MVGVISAARGLKDISYDIKEIAYINLILTIGQPDRHVNWQTGPMMFPFLLVL